MINKLQPHEIISRISNKGEKMKDWLVSYFIGFALTFLIITIIELKG